MGVTDYRDDLEELQDVAVKDEGKSLCQSVFFENVEEETRVGEEIVPIAAVFRMEVT